MQELSIFFRALADRKRLRIARYLADHESVTVSDLGAELRMSQPLISWHLRILRRCGVVKTRRSGRQVYCSLNRSAILGYERQMDALFGLHRAEFEELERVPAEDDQEETLKGVELWPKSG